jgi:hypothetical protein
MRIPYKQEIRVKMGILETMKLAWMQYVTFFIVIFYIVYKILLDYAFTNRILESTTSSELASLRRKQY